MSGGGGVKFKATGIAASSPPFGTLHGARTRV